MSIDRRPTKDQRRDAAREKARAMREAAARKHRRNRVLALSGAIVAALVVVGLVALAITSSGSSAPVATPKGVTATGGILSGSADAPHTVAIYQDYQCPYCKQFEESANSWLEQQRDAGQLAIEFRPISFLDQSSSGNRYSTRAANAAACVAADGGADFSKWNDAMYAQQPAEGSNGRSDSALITIAKKAGAGSGVGRCITDETYKGWVEKTTTKAMSKSGGGVTGTPTILVDGKVVENSQVANGVPTLADVQAALGMSGQ